MCQPESASAKIYTHTHKGATSLPPKQQLDLFPTHVSVFILKNEHLISSHLISSPPHPSLHLSFIPSPTIHIFLPL